MYQSIWRAACARRTNRCHDVRARLPLLTGQTTSLGFFCALLVVPASSLFLVEYGTRPAAGCSTGWKNVKAYVLMLEHLATLTRNQVRFAGTRATVPALAESTSIQRETFDLIGAPVPPPMT